MLRQNTDVENMQMELGKTYEITYLLPERDVADYQKLQSNLSRIITTIINSNDFKYVRSQLQGNIFRIAVTLKKPQGNMSGLGILPVVAFGVYVLGATVITALVGYGLKWSVTSVKEISAPVIAISQSLLPIAIIVGLIWFAPHIAMLLPSRKK